MKYRNRANVLPLYESADLQYHKKWWVGCPHVSYVLEGNLIPFQYSMPKDGSFDSLEIVELESGTKTDIKTKAEAAGLSLKLNRSDYDLIQFPGVLPLAGVSLPMGGYYLEIGWNGKIWTTEVFGITDDVSEMIKIEYWHLEDFEYPGGVLAYDGVYKSRVYLQSDIAKPEYGYSEQVVNQDGKILPLQQISWKAFKFRLPLPEYLTDALRLVRLHDGVEISYGGEDYEVDTFLMDTPRWDGQADYADVEFEFRTDTVIVVNGKGYEDASYGVDAGACLLESFKAKAEVEEGSEEWNEGYYLLDGVNVDLEVGDYVVSVINGEKALRNWTGSGYGFVPLANLQAVYTEREDSYYFYDLNKNLLLQPQIYSVTRTNVEGEVIGESFEGSSVRVMANNGIEERQVGFGTVEDLRSGLSFEFVSGDFEIYIVAVTAACPEFVAVSDRAAIPGAQRVGIGTMKIGSTFIIR